MKQWANVRLVVQYLGKKNFELLDFDFLRKGFVYSAEAGDRHSIDVLLTDETCNQFKRWIDDLFFGKAEYNDCRGTCPPGFYEITGELWGEIVGDEDARFKAELREESMYKLSEGEAASMIKDIQDVYGDGVDVQPM